MRQDYAGAFRLLKPLAEQGDAEAQDLVGIMYRNGWGVAPDAGAAQGWWRRAAASGNAAAQFSLGMMYKSGAGVNQDYTVAAKWFRQSAGRGNWQAQLQLGTMYGSGLGVKRDYVAAYMWYLLEQKQGLDARRWLSGLAAKMTPGQVAEAGRRARDWKPVAGAAEN